MNQNSNVDKNIATWTFSSQQSTTTITRNQGTPETHTPSSQGDST